MDKNIGRMLDNRYELLEVIGTGGMAVVYKAKCHRLNRLVAIKILKGEFSEDAEFRRRFHAESQAVAMLSHPNIVSVYDVSRSSEVEYIVMELIDGITLKQYMQRKGTLTWREALYFTTQIVKALGHAHGRGIIHRDIKPHNIMILRDGSIKVADFGIARFTAKQNTLTQEALGSVHYISPEQARGSHIDARSDIYSVGVVLYEMLTGRLPFEGDSPVSVAIQHINSMPLTPREINPDIPPALESITMKAMSANLSRRYASSDQMLYDLEEFRKNPSIQFNYPIATENTSGQSADAEEPTRVAHRTGDIQPQRSTPMPAHRSDRGRSNPKRKPATALALLGGLAAAVVFIGVIIYLLLSLMNFTGDRPSSSPTEVTVPSLVGMDLKTARSTLEGTEDTKKMTVRESGRETSETVAAGKIIRQTPDADTKDKPDVTINVIISSGSGQFVMKDYAGQDYRIVKVELEQNDLTVNEPTYEKSETIPDNCVIRTEPGRDAVLQKGDAVTLIVSRNDPEIEKVSVPNLVGKTTVEAEIQLMEIGLQLGTITPSVENGTIISQEPKFKSSVDPGTMIDVVVESGSAPSPSPTASDAPAPTTSVTPPPTSAPPSPPPASASPDLTPSQSPQDPTPNPALKKDVLEVKLPEGTGKVTVTVKKNGVQIFSQEFDKSERFAHIPIEGTSADMFDIFNGETQTNFNFDQ